MKKVLRLFKLHDSLREGSRVLNARDWGQMFGVNVRTVLRDLAFLKEELEMPLIYDSQLKGYRYLDSNPQVMSDPKPSKWTRLLTLIHRITAEPGQTAKQLAEATGRNERTIFRDIRQLEDAGFPVYNDGGYRFATDAFLPAVNLTPSELYSLFIAVRFLESQSGGDLGAEGRQALEKLLRGTSENRRLDLGVLRDHVQVSELTEDTGMSLLLEMQQALGHGMQIEILYQGLKDEAALPRVLDPMGLFCFRQVWYLHAFDHGKQGLRNFRLSRIESVESLDEPVKNAAKMEIQEASYHRWDIEGDQSFEVVLKVSDKLARWLEENPAHPSQALEGAEVRYRVTDLKAMARWIAGLYGLEVLEPAELRSELQALGSELCGVYGD